LSSSQVSTGGIKSRVTCHNSCSRSLKETAKPPGLETKLHAPGQPAKEDRTLKLEHVAMNQYSVDGSHGW